jgi:DNA-binding XRE family transcriptional regulator
LGEIGLITFRQLRDEAGVSASELFKSTGVSERTIRRIESDPEYHPARQTAVKLLDELGRRLQRELTPEAVGLQVDDPQKRAHRKNIPVDRDVLQRLYALLEDVPVVDDGGDVQRWRDDRRELVGELARVLGK